MTNHNILTDTIRIADGCADITMGIARDLRSGLISISLEGIENRTRDYFADSPWGAALDHHAIRTLALQIASHPAIRDRVRN